MNILAPVNTLESAKAVILSGAKEIYLGADENVFKTFSFTGRGKYGYAGNKVLSNFSEVKEIVDYSHGNNVKVNFLCNYQFLCNSNSTKTDIDKYLINYIESGLESGIDAIVIGDIGLIKMITKRKYNIDLHASVFFRSLNEQQLLFLKDLGVKRTVLSYHITMNDIKYLVSRNIMDLEVIGYLGCSFYNGACNFLHDYGEGVYNDFEPGVSCKGKYLVSDGERSDVCKIFDAESGCALCVIGELEKAGVRALKIVGRERDHKQTARVIELYVNILEHFRENGELIDIEEKKPFWWKKLWCSKKRCKYKESNNNYKYMIGV